MNRIRTLVAISCLLLSCGTISRAFPAEDADDSVAIQKALAQFAGNFNTHDAHTFVMSFTADEDFVNGRGDFVHGRKELEDHQAGMFKGALANVQDAIAVKRVRFLRPDVAAVDADWTFTGMKAPNGSVTTPVHIVLALTMIKQNGQWLITVFHEIPAETPAQPK